MYNLIAENSNHSNLYKQIMLDEAALLNELLGQIQSHWNELLPTIALDISGGAF